MYGLRTGAYRAPMSSKAQRKPPDPPNRVREFRKAAGVTQEQLAEKLNTTHATIQRIETGKQALTDTWLYALAKVLKRRPAELLRIQPGARAGMVVGAVAAGVWREALEWPEDERYEMPLFPDDRFPGARRFGLEVRGPSMNLYYPPGSVVVCVRFLDIDRAPKQGDRVVVQRYDQDQVEATLKEFVVDEQGRKWLWPRSSDPDFQQPWPVIRQGEAKDRLEIWALVVGSYKRE